MPTIAAATATVAAPRTPACSKAGAAEQRVHADRQRDQDSDDVVARQCGDEAADAVAEKQDNAAGGDRID
jgi:hypothetical protein